jgi:hypothetical protein
MVISYGSMGFNGDLIWFNQQKREMLVDIPSGKVQSLHV